MSEEFEVSGSRAWHLKGIRLSARQTQCEPYYDNDDDDDASRRVDFDGQGGVLVLILTYVPR